MSKKESSPGENDQAPDLSALDFGPAWARKDVKKKSPRATQGKRREGKQQQTSSQSGGGARRDTRGNQARGQARGRGRDDRRDTRDRNPVVAPAEGVAARIMPIEEGMDALAKQISATGRTHSVFDLAWLVLGAMDRFHVIFECEEKPLYRSRDDHSVWLTQKECLAHFWSANLVKKYYDEEITEVDPPAGNFQSVARCGFSKQLIGPPNHHAYQQTLLDLHREKFSNMPIERYKAKIIMEHGEEVVQEWMEAMKKHVRWRPKEEPAVESASDENADKPESPDAPPSLETPPEPTPAEPATPVIEATVVILDNHREVEQHFLSHGFEQAFECNAMVSALANIPPRMISPSLMALLRHTVEEEKRYPGNLASILCRQMSGRHLAVYKWKKRLHCGPARPRHVSDGMVMADRPAKLFQWVNTQPGGNLDAMWEHCLPEGIDDDARHLWYHDLHWLINEGLVLLLSDGTLHAAKELGEQPAKKKSPKKKPVKAKKKKPAEEKPSESPPQET